MMRTILTLLAVLMLALAPLALAQEPDEADDEKRDGDNPESEKDQAEDAPDLDANESEADDKAHEDADDARKDADEVKRKVKVETSEDQVQIKLSRESGDVEDAVKIVYSADEGWMKVAYETENATLEAETELKVRFRELVEFVDNDSDGAYTPDVDEALQQFSHEDFAWTILAPKDITNDAGVGGKKIVGTGALDAGGNLSFVMYVFGDFTVVNGTSLRPTDVKIDILVDDFAYTHDASQVALLFQTEQEAKLESDDGDAAPEGVNATANGFTAYFTWAEEALVDGSMTPVRTTMVESEDKSESDESESKEKAERKFWFSYARGAAINHDPVMGVAAEEPDSTASASPDGTATTEESPASGSNTPGIGAMLVVAAVGALALTLRRRA